MDHTIEIADTGIPGGIVEIINQLPTREDCKDDDVSITLSFKNAYVFRTGLVLLATWRKALPRHVRVVIDDTDLQETAKRLLINTGFRDEIESASDAATTIHYFPGRIPVQPMVRGYSTEKTISEICAIFDQTAGGAVDVNAFRVLLSELCENTFAHSEFETPGYICAQLHGDRCEIAIADSGIGIRQSYLEGTNADAIARISGGTSAIELALDGLSSSKPTPVPGTSRSYYGYGLFIVRRLMEENRGRLTIVSGGECISVERYQKTRIPLIRPWVGTFVGLLIDINNPLPLERVYQEGVDLLVPSEESQDVAPPSPTSPVTKEIALAAYARQLLTRDLGTAVRADIATVLSSGSRVKVILDGVEDLTPSVADECFGKLAEAMGRKRFDEYVILAGGQPILQRLIEFVIANRLSGE